jgi:hypothetical protein
VREKRVAIFEARLGPELAELIERLVSALNAALS